MAAVGTSCQHEKAGKPLPLIINFLNLENGFPYANNGPNDYDLENSVYIN